MLCLAIASDDAASNVDGRVHESTNARLRAHGATCAFDRGSTVQTDRGSAVRFCILLAPKHFLVCCRCGAVQQLSPSCSCLNSRCTACRTICSRRSSIHTAATLHLPKEPLPCEPEQPLPCAGQRQGQPSEQHSPVPVRIAVSRFQARHDPAQAGKCQWAS